MTVETKSRNGPKCRGQNCIYAKRKMNLIFFYFLKNLLISQTFWKVYLHLFRSHGDTICNWHVDTLHGGDTISNCKRLLSHHHRSSLSPLFSITVHHSSILLRHPIVFFLSIYITNPCFNFSFTLYVSSSLA